MTTMVRSVVVSRHGAGAEAENSRLNPKLQAESQGETGPGVGFCSLKAHCQ